MDGFIVLVIICMIPLWAMLFIGGAINCIEAERKLWNKPQKSRPKVLEVRSKPEPEKYVDPRSKVLLRGSEAPHDELLRPSMDTHSDKDLLRPDTCKKQDF